MKFPIAAATLALLVLSFSAPRTAAQEKTATESGLFFEVVFWGDWMQRPLKYRSEDGMKAIPLQPGDPTCYLYSGPSPIIFYREEAADPATGELKPVPVLSIDFKPTWKRAAMIIAAGENDKLSARMIPLTQQVFPSDSVYLVNASGKELKCKLEDKTWEMKADEQKLFPLPTRETKVYLLAASLWNGSWQMMYSDSFRPLSGERRIIYFHTPRGTEGVTSYSAVIPPDSARFDAAGNPLESAMVDPNFVPSDDPSGFREFKPQP